MKHAFTVTAVAAATLALAFLVVPVVALFLRVPPRDLIHALGTSAAQDALVVSLKTSAIAHAAVLLVGTPAAYAIGRRRFRGRALLLSLIELPLVLPPAVAGIALLVTFGRLGLLGGTMSALGIDIAFTQVAVILAVAFVETPLYLRAAIARRSVVLPAPEGPTSATTSRPTVSSTSRVNSRSGMSREKWSGSIRGST